MNKILARILAAAANTPLFEALSEKLSLADLQSLLLEVYRRRVVQLDANQLFSQYKNNRFVQPAGIDPKRLAEFDRLAFSLLPHNYELVELSPVAPLGSCSLLGPVDQNNVLTTIRTTEVVADSTDVLALECARRREKQYRAGKRNPVPVKLAASHRLLRTQFIAARDTVPHFRLLALCSAGRDTGSYSFELSELQEQVSYYIRLLQQLKSINLEIASIRILFILFDAQFAAISTPLQAQLSALYPGVSIAVQTPAEKHNYYNTARYQIFITNKQDEEFFICDGGFTDWTQKLLNNRKERCLIGGLGTERLFLVC
ncbi:MAG TPA: hypothetical protein PLP19_09685 [bacterium]|nr:hypothetical protein [bacterium]HPN43748.1 hypothetical protein [bacterium]